MDFDLAVVGAGSGGFGAALAAARRGLRVILVEQAGALGGTSTLAGVNTWEPGVGGPGFHGELFRRLLPEHNAIGLSRTVKYWTTDEPWGLSRIVPGLDYRCSLRRAGISSDLLTRVTFEPAAMDRALSAMLSETGRVQVELNTSLIGAEASSETVTRIIVSTHGAERQIAARFFIDATGQIALCAKLGCATSLGAEAKSSYGEPSAPPAHKQTLNGVSLCFRATPTRVPVPVPPEDEKEFLPCNFSITEYPCGDLNFNPLPLMQGWEFQQIDPSEARRECERRVQRTWRWLQCRKGFGAWRLSRIFPMIGVREGPRLIGRCVLTENDVRQGCSSRRAPERWIALADHDLDVHGEGFMQGKLKEPYGVPYECLLPKEYGNLAVASRGTSFSHLAASSCRLSRTIMQLGHAAGLAAAEALASRCALPDIELARVRARLAEDNVALAPDDPRFSPRHNQ